MKDKKDILSDWQLRDKPQVPGGFFDHFADNLMERIESESGILGQLKKSKKPSVPDGFFDNLLSAIETDSDQKQEETHLVDQLSKRTLPEVPTNYFEQFENDILEKVQNMGNGSAKRGRIISLRLITTVTSIAAAIAIIFSIVDFSPNDPKNSSGPIVEEANEMADNYLAYMDEDELIDYIIEYDIEIDDTTDLFEYDDYDDFSEEDIEDYYLDL